MTYPEDRVGLFKALRIIGASSAYPVVLAWLNANKESNWQQICSTVDERLVNRLIGENKVISELIKEIGDSPANETACANAEASGGISLPI